MSKFTLGQPEGIGVVEPGYGTFGPVEPLSSAFLPAPPPPTEVERSDSQIGFLVEQLCDRARMLGEKFGVSLKDFPLERPAVPSTSDERLVHAIVNLSPHEAVSLERVRDAWGLWYRSSVGGLQPRPAVPAMPLRDAPLAARRQFLLRSDAFFTEYMRQTVDKLKASTEAISAGVKTVERLDAFFSSEAMDSASKGARPAVLVGQPLGLPAPKGALPSPEQVRHAIKAKPIKAKLIK
ncbi:hypothetical protein [Corallococcus silvisoli]|uniref:hypothetical protein n=1 Tax=Corallococcus silvisoli TaxID=2697031 RepID=UPI001377E8F9|nr:hypothetical protein [Corallococcus silvisoli]NBD09251.1 hypothetical protein [Corallococcus silvisoli]